ncbi:MAG: AAA family ATPase [Pseudomonadota bacterium]
MTGPAADHGSISHTPYPGLRSFLRAEFDIFFGRDDHVSEMVDKLSETHFLCVTGPSGCGKSSLARTGLFNALEAGFLSGRGSDWIYCDLYPETDPINRLASALSQAVVTGESGRGAPEPDASQAELIGELRNLFLNHIEYRSSNLTTALDGLTMVDGRPIVILVDQFEEIFRYAQDDLHEASRFVDVLLKTAAARKDVYVVITIRTDELEKCARYSGLTNTINQSQFLTPTLDRFQMQEAIEGPISLFGGRIEPDLSIWMLNGLEEQLDKLPLMQHALRLLYIEARRKMPTGEIAIGLEDFFRAFGIDGAKGRALSRGHDALRMSLSHRLDKIYRGLKKPDRRIARGLFCALTTLGSRGRDIRRPIKLGEAMEVLDCDFESLMRVVGAFRDGAEGYLRIAGEHDGIDPTDTVDVAHECVLRLWSPLQDTWLPAESRSAADIRFLARLARERAQVSRSLKDRVLGVGLLKGSTRKRHSDWWAAWRPNAAWAARHLTHLHWREGDAVLDPKQIFDRVRGFVRNSDRYAMYQGMAAAAGVGFALVLGAYLVDAQAEADARVAAAQREMEVQRQENALRLETLVAEERARQAERDQLVSIRQTLEAIRPDAAATEPMQVALQAAEALQAAVDADVGPDALRLGQARMHEALAHIHELRRFVVGERGEHQIYAAAYLGDGTRIVTLTAGLELSLWDRTENGAPVTSLSLAEAVSRRDGAEGRSLAVSPDGSLAVGTQRGAVLLIEDFGAASAEPRVTELYAGRDEWQLETVTGLDFSADGRGLIAGSLTGHVHVWRRGPAARWTGGTIFSVRNLRDRATGTPVQAVDGTVLGRRADRVWSVALAPGGDHAAIGLQDGTVCLMTLDGVEAACAGEAHSEPVKAVRFAPNGETLISGGNDDVLRPWDLTAGSGGAAPAAGAIPRLPGLALSPVSLWRDSDIWDVDFSPDGSLLAATSWDGSTGLYETDGWRPLEVLRGHTQSPRTVQFGPDGREVLTAALDKTARIWTPFESRLSDYGLNGTMPGPGDRQVLSLALGPGADWVAFTNRSAIWARARGAAPWPVFAPGAAGSDPRMIVAADGADTLLAAMRDPEVRIWALSGGDWVQRVLPLGGDLAASPRDRRKLALSGDGAVFAVNVAGPDGQWVLVCRTDAAICGTEAGAHLALVPFEAEMVTGRPSGHACIRAAYPTALALSAAGDRLAVGGSDCNIRLFDLPGGGDPAETLAVAEHHVGSITALDFARDGAFVVAASADWQGSVWRPGGDAAVLLRQHRTSVSDAKALPSGQFVATVSSDEQLIVWDSETGAPVLTLPGFTSTIHALDVAASDDGIKLAAGTRAGDILVQRFFETPEGVLAFADRTLKKIMGGPR